MSNRHWIILTILLALAALSLRAQTIYSPATAAQVAAGTDKTHFITPKGLADSGVLGGGGGTNSPTLNGTQTFTGANTFSGGLSVTGGSSGFIVTNQTIHVSTVVGATGVTNVGLTGSTNLAASVSSSQFPWTFYRTNATVDDVNTASAVNVISFTVPGNYLTNHILKVTFDGSIVNSGAASSNLTMVIKFGVTTVYSSLMTVVTSTPRRAVHGELFMMCSNGVSNLEMGDWQLTVGGSTAATVGTATPGTANMISATMMKFTDAAEDVTTDKALVLQTTWPGASSSVSFQVNSVAATFY